MVRRPVGRCAEPQLGNGTIDKAVMDQPQTRAAIVTYLKSALKFTEEIEDSARPI
jgi:hypothetical protein